MSLEHKFCTGPQAVTVTDGQVISGYASLFGATDQGGDIVEAGAYRISLAKGRRIKMLWQHDAAQPIGVWDEVREDATGIGEAVGTAMQELTDLNTEINDAHSELANLDKHIQVYGADATYEEVEAAEAAENVANEVEPELEAEA